MVCLRCGHCCQQYDVVIIRPEFANEKFKMSSVESYEDAEKVSMVKEGGDPCPHFEQEENETRCKVHHYKWYKDTPCFSYGQIESKVTDNCRMGEYLLRRRSND